LISVAFLAPLFLNGWKSLMVWHIIISAFVTYLILLIVSNTGSAAGSLGAIHFIIIISSLHILSCSFKGLQLYRSNGKTLKAFPLYAIGAGLSYMLILVVIIKIGLTAFA